MRTHGSGMVCGDGDSEDDIRIHFAWAFVHGQRDRKLEREFFRTYYRLDERAPRLRRRPRGFVLLGRATPHKR